MSISPEEIAQDEAHYIVRQRAGEPLVDCFKRCDEANKTALSRLEAYIATVKEQAAEIERLREEVGALRDLVTAYRLGSHTKADAALSRLAALRGREE